MKSEERERIFNQDEINEIGQAFSIVKKARCQDQYSTVTMIPQRCDEIGSQNCLPPKKRCDDAKALISKSREIERYAKFQGNIKC